MMDINAALADWLDKGRRQIGQITIVKSADGWELHHTDDAGREDLQLYTKSADARQLANLDDAGAYRALKTAPNLRHGWRLVLPDVATVRSALDAFYPAMIGVQLARERGELTPVNLRDTLARQTGMYRVTQKLTDEQAQSLIASSCRCDGGCLKIILWRISEELPVNSLPAEKFTVRGENEWPLLCHEACNILVAGARKVVKGEPKEG